jgi:hypothetical protein
MTPPPNLGPLRGPSPQGERENGVDSGGRGRGGVGSAGADAGGGCPARQSIPAVTRHHSNDLRVRRGVVTAYRGAGWSGQLWPRGAPWDRRLYAADPRRRRVGRCVAVGAGRDAVGRQLRICHGGGGAADAGRHLHHDHARVRADGVFRRRCTRAVRRRQRCAARSSGAVWHQRTLQPCGVPYARGGAAAADAAVVAPAGRLALRARTVRFTTERGTRDCLRHQRHTCSADRLHRRRRTGRAGRLAAGRAQRVRQPGLHGLAQLGRAAGDGDPGRRRDGGGRGTWCHRLHSGRGSIERSDRALAADRRPGDRAVRAAAPAPGFA